MRSLFLIVLLAPFASIVACGGEDEKVVNDDTNEVNVGKASEGGLCGGFAGTKCADGLRCTLGSEGLNTGRCVKNSTTPRPDPTTSPGENSSGGSDDGAGATCGGFAGTTCKAPLRCDNSLGLNTGRCR